MNAHTPCAYEGCDKSPAKDHIALFRVNPKGERGVFMCRDHAALVDSPPQPPFGAVTDSRTRTDTEESL